MPGSQPFGAAASRSWRLVQPAWIWVYPSSPNSHVVSAERGLFSNISEHADQRTPRTCADRGVPKDACHPPMPPSDPISTSAFAVGTPRKVVKNRSALGRTSR